MQVDRILSPGAATSTYHPQEEKVAARCDESVAPTAMTLGDAAGHWIAELTPSLLAAASTTVGGLPRDQSPVTALIVAVMDRGSGPVPDSDRLMMSAPCWCAHRMAAVMSD